MNNDLINGCFELFAGMFQLLNIRLLLKDKEVKGVSPLPTIFHSLWGLWNIYYYPTLGQTFSFLGGIFIVVTNASWLFLILYFRLTKR